jgi:uncharacterized protein with GYD domain
MGTYLMFGEYTLESVGKISAKRTEKAGSLIAAAGGKLKGGYALLGDKDVLLIAEFPGTEEAMKASVAMSKEFGIAFTTNPALTVDEFDKLF